MDKKLIDTRECCFYTNHEARFLLVQPVDEQELDLMDREVESIEELSGKPFSMVCLRVKDWNTELTPWTAPPVFGKVPFGSNASDTLDFIIKHLLPQEDTVKPHCLLGGYSLAGLFALWAACQTNKFEVVVAASPSVWYPDWLSYASQHKLLAKSVYLSLGAKEEKTKNKVMSGVGNAIREMHDLLAGQDINTILEWNPGNHFVDSEKRMAKGFAWAMNQIE